MFSLFEAYRNYTNVQLQFKLGALYEFCQSLLLRKFWTCIVAQKCETKAQLPGEEQNIQETC